MTAHAILLGSFAVAIAIAFLAKRVGDVAGILRGFVPLHVLHHHADAQRVQVEHAHLHRVEEKPEPWQGGQDGP